MEIKCRKCSKTYLIDDDEEEEWDHGKIYTCYECQGEEFDKVKNKT